MLDCIIFVKVIIYAWGNMYNVVTILSAACHLQSFLRKPAKQTHCLKPAWGKAVKLKHIWLLGSNCISKQQNTEFKQPCLMLPHI